MKKKYLLTLLVTTVILFSCSKETVCDVGYINTFKAELTTQINVNNDCRPICYDGYGRMYKNANLIFHMIMPLVAMTEFVVFPAFESEKGNAFSFKKCLYAGIPVVLYGSVYLINNILNGSGEASPNNTDFYGFLRWGYPVGILIFIVIVFIAVGITCFLRWIKKKTIGRTGPRSMPVR